jgi:hypothetical protein
VSRTLRSSISSSRGRISREMGSKGTIALADGRRVEDRTENGMLESGEPEDRNCLEKHLTV